MAKLRQQNERLKDELKDLSKQLENYIEKTRV
jgi:cell division protein FtsB